MQHKQTVIKRCRIKGCLKKLNVSTKQNLKAVSEQMCNAVLSSKFFEDKRDTFFYPMVSEQVASYL